MHDHDWPEGVNQDDVLELIDAVAGSVFRKYRKYVTVDDLRQEMRLHAWKRRSKFAEYLTREDEGKRRAGEAAFMKAMHRVGESYARREKARQDGYDPTDEFFYTNTLVEAVIAAQLHGTLLTPLSNERRSPTDPAEGGNQIIMMIDVSDAISRLEPAAQTLLREVFGLQIPITDIAAREGVTQQAIRGRVDRAMRRILWSLGGDNPHY